MAASTVKAPLLLGLVGLGAWLVLREKKSFARGVNMALASTGRVLGYKKGVPIPIEVAEIAPGLVLRKDAAAAFLRMQSAALKDGVRIKANTAFRSNEYQAELWELSQRTDAAAIAEKKRRGVTGVVAKPGFSNHQSGEAVDIDTTSDPRVYPWLALNAKKYGFKSTVPTEKWHWEYQI